MMSLTRATFAGIKDLKEDLDRNSQRINSLIGEVDDMAYVLKAHNDAITDVKHAIIFMNHYFNQIYVRLERYLDLFKTLKADTLLGAASARLAAQARLNHLRYFYFVLLIYKTITSITVSTIYLLMFFFSFTHHASFLA